ncbi:MAG: T9SS type A sorting domain-containing protein [Bacteroidales bacterium]|nr:T9SS type A sorting domain-containing protein [Bacteroidales bacterium]
MKKWRIIFLLFLIIVSNNFLFASAAQDSLFESFTEFKNTLDSLANIENSSVRDSVLEAFWDTLKVHRQVPFVLGDSVAFLYKGSANTVSWAGDFNGWNPSASEYKGKKVGLSNIWKCETTFPGDARLDYKIVVNSNWILDPANPFQQWSGFGPNSELRMPDWIFPEETVRRPDLPRGTFSSNIKISSTNLGYAVNYRIYTPAGYDSFFNLPVIYVTDGHEYSDDRLGSKIIVLDNLIFDKKIMPVIAVFIDPRNPSNLSQNRRESEYTINEKFANFVADELVPQIDSNFKTNQSPDKRAILGTSLGGINSAYFGIIRSGVFRLIAIQSPAFKYKPEIYSMYQNSSKLPLKIFMSTGVIHDTESSARQMKQILESKEYSLKYIEVNEGHSWGNWRALLDEMLIYFFGTATKVKFGEKKCTQQNLLLVNNYPNPFNSSTNINFFLSNPQNVTLDVFNILGQKIETIQFKKNFSAGLQSIKINSNDWTTGIYWYKLLTEKNVLTGKMLLMR